MGFGDAIQTCLSKYATFSGRAARSEYWWFYLFIFLVFVVLVLLDMTLFGFDPEDPTDIPVIAGLGLLALFLPTLAAVVRRLHDTDRSGWWYLISFIPLIGGLVLLYFLVSKGTEGPNRFGPNPLG